MEENSTVNALKIIQRKHIETFLYLLKNPQVESNNRRYWREDLKILKLFFKRRYLTNNKTHSDMSYRFDFQSGLFCS